MHPPSAEKIPDGFRPTHAPTRWSLARLVKDGSRPWILRLRWGHIVSIVFALGLTGYFAAATAAFAFVRTVRKVDTVEFTDLALPWRWSHYRIARGEQQIAEARRLLTEAKFAEALLYLRNGVARAPADRGGRLLLVELLGAARRPELARETLLDGLRYHAGDPTYLKPVLNFLLQQQEDARLVALARQYLPTLPPASEAAQLFAFAAATAGHLRGNFDEAEDFLRENPRLGPSRDGRLLAAKIERDRGYGDLAVLRLRQLAADFPHDAEVTHELLSLLRVQGRVDEARRITLAFQIAHPHLAGPRLDLLRTYREAGDTAQVRRETDALLRDLATDQAALLALADFAADAGDVALVTRVSAHAAAQKFPTAPYTLLGVEAALVARDYRGALTAIRAHLATDNDWARHHRALFESLQALAHFGLGEAPQARASLASFLAHPNLRSDNLLAVANRFAALEGSGHAWQILARAIELDPRNQTALTRLIELDLELGRMAELTLHLRQFVKMRRPSPDILRVVRYKLGSDLWLFSAETPETLAVVEKALAQF